MEKCGDTPHWLCCDSLNLIYHISSSRRRTLATPLSIRIDVRVPPKSTAPLGILQIKWSKVMPLTSVFFSFFFFFLFLFYFIYLFIFYWYSHIISVGQIWKVFSEVLQRNLQWNFKNVWGKRGVNTQNFVMVCAKLVP